VPLELCLLEAVSHVDGVNHLLDYYELDDVFALVLERPPRCQVYIYTPLARYLVLPGPIGVNSYWAQGLKPPPPLL